MTALPSYRVPGPDPWLLCSTDYASLELATVAQVCINLGLRSTMADAINAKQDLHVRMAKRVLSLPYEECLARYKAKEQAIVDVRQSMKPVNYGLAGLMGPPKLVLTARKDGVYFCEGAGISKKGECHKQPRVTQYGSGRNVRDIPPTCAVCLDLAKKYKDLWYEEFPEMEQYHEVTIELARRGEAGEPLESFGTGMLRLEKSANAASNHFFQSLAAQGAKHAAWLISKESYTDRRSVLFNNLRIAVFLHDECLTEVREAVAHEAAWRQSALMVEGMKVFVPDVRIEAEPALMRRWFKGADKAVGRDGRLKPWWPVDARCRPSWPIHVESCTCWKWEPDRKLMERDLAA